MKKIIFLFLIVHCALLIDNCFSQWQPDVRLTNDPANSFTSYNNARCIAANGNIVHTVWYDNRDANNEIYYKRSTDSGISWGADTRLTVNSSISIAPSISVTGSPTGGVHIVWWEDRDGNWEIYYKRSTDGGVSWGADTRLTNNIYVSQNPSIISSGQTLHVVWYESRDLNYEIYYKHSTDGGINWGVDTRLTNNNLNSRYPSVSATNMVVQVVWEDDRDGNFEIYHKRSTDGGISWGFDTRLTNNSSYSNKPSISESGTVVHVIWWDLRDFSTGEIYYKRSTDGGINWSNDTRLTNNAAYSENPSVSVSTSFVHVVWKDGRDGNSEIYYKRSTDDGISWEADTRLTNSVAYSDYPSLSSFGSAVNLVWYDSRDGNFEIYNKRNPTGNPVGINPLNYEIPTDFSLLQNYPNPFNPVTNIKFQLPKAGFVKLTVFDMLGREVEILINDNLNAGTYNADWNAANYSSGVYFYKLEVGEYSEVYKMILIK